MKNRILNESDYKTRYEFSLKNPEKYWDQIASQFHWSEKYTEVLSGDFSNPLQMEWFKNGKTNITLNCLDKNVEKNPERVAMIFEDNAGKSTTLTYKELLQEVCLQCHHLEKAGLKKGDVLTIYMGMRPEIIINMLAAARMGAIHSVVFAGFSTLSLRERIIDSHSKILVTHDEISRGDKKISLGKMANEAIKDLDCSILIYNKNIMSQEKIENTFYPAVIVDSNHPLFILYTSGSTGKPKGLVHSAGGYMVWSCETFLQVFGVDPTQGDTFWCTADAGWITGHSYVCYGPLLNGVTQVIYEGVPTYPKEDRLWSIIEKHQVTHFYTAPTLIRSLMPYGHEIVEKHNMSSLKVLGSVGEPINEEAWQWFHEYVGRKNCPIVDTWWQTETGGIMISNLAGITPSVPTMTTFPLPGVKCELKESYKNEQGDLVGDLVISRPWPGLAKTIWGDPERFMKTYFSKYPQSYFTGDGARLDYLNRYRITGRVDDVLNVSGHRLSTAEIENCINEHSLIIESAVIGRQHHVKGEVPIAFCICEQGTHLDNEIFLKEVNVLILKMIGPIAKISELIIVKQLPKTRSGKIMRRLLKKVIAGESDFGDTSTLLNPDCMKEIVEVIK